MYVYRRIQRGGEFEAAYDDDHWKNSLGVLHLILWYTPSITTSIPSFNSDTVDRGIPNGAL